VKQTGRRVLIVISPPLVAQEDLAHGLDVWKNLYQTCCLRLQMTLDTHRQIRHLASSYESFLVAAGEFEHSVSIWDVERAEKTAEFETVLDFGGSRLLITDDGKFCVTAAYYIHGVACYSAADGTRIWQRKDLKKAQRLTPSRDGKSLFCGFSEGPCELLDLRTGETTAKIRAA
jgi:hypothetical protein